MGLRASPAPTQVELRAPTDHFALFCRSEGLLFLPKARQWATWTGRGNGPPLTRRSNILFERATPAYALLERLFERALARASACASLHIEVLPAAGAA